MATYNSIHVNVNKAYRTANTLSAKKDELQNVCSGISTAVNSLKQNGWNGNNADKYCALLEAQREKISKLAAHSEQIANAIKATAKAYERAEIAKLDAEKDARQWNGKGSVPKYRGPYDDYNF